MTTIIGYCCAAALAAFSAMGLYDLQSWLERRDYDRHFED